MATELGSAQSSAALTLPQRGDQHHLRSLMGQAGGMNQGYILMILHLAEHPWLTNQLSPSIPLSLPPPSTLFLFLFPSSIQAPQAQTHLYRRDGLTGSPGWQSPAPGDTGW